MAKAADMVNEYIQENPEESMKILSTIVPNIGIGQIFANKEDSDEEISEDIDVEVEEKPKKLSGKEKGMRIKEAIRRARAGKGNYSSPDAEGDAVDIRGSVIREVEDMGIADKNLKDKPYKEKGYDFRDYIPKGAYRRRKADGGSIGIEVLFGPKRQELFMGGPALTGPALGIYNSMKAYNSFTDQEIADAIKQAGYDLPTADSGTTTPPNPTPDSSNQAGGGNEGQGGIMNLDPYRNVASPGNQSNNFLNKTVSTIGDFAGSMMDKFSGTNVGEGITSAASKFKNMAITPIMALMQTRNPLNPNASNYNPNLQGQIDMLGGMTGTKISGTYIDPYNKQLGFTDNLTGQAMIGRDPNSGLAKYGPGSVLAGQNVVSGFGTNDYEDQLQGYIDKMLDRRTKGVLTEFQQKKLDAAYAELERAKTQAIEDAAKKKREMDAKIAAAEKLKEVTQPQFNPNTTSGGVGTYTKSKDHSGDGGYGHTSSSPGATTGSAARSRHSRSSDLGFSDIRLKENVELIGKSPSNINIYKFNYKNNPTTYQGAMAHEVPWASVKHSNGYMMIDYNQIDVDFKKI
jgi:ribosomal protein L9